MKITIELNGLDELLELKQWIAPLQPRVVVGNVFDLELSVRAVNCLSAINVTTIDQLTNRTERDLLMTPNLGRRALNEIKSALAGRGLALKGASFTTE